MEDKKTTKKTNVKKNTKGKNNATTKKKSTTTKKSNNTVKKKTVTNKNVKTNSKTTIKEKKQPEIVKEEKQPEIVKKEKIDTAKVEKPNFVKKEEIKAVPKVKDSSDFGGDEIRKLLIIIGAVCAVMLAFYFITEVVLKNKKDKNTEKNPIVDVEPTIQYEEILMGSLLNQKESDYYVLAYDPEDELIGIYMNFISSYEKSEEPLMVYKVDLSKDYNKSYISEESYLTGSDVSKVRVKGTTLIRVSNGSVYKFFEGKDDIISRFKYMLELD